MKKAIEHLEELNKKYEATKRTYESDLKLGFKSGVRKYFDPVFYDEQGHKEVIAAIEELSKLRQGAVSDSVCDHNWKEWEDSICNAQMRCTKCKKIFKAN